MYIGADDGCQEVPEPIAPIDITLWSLEPTRMPMSSFFITTSGPMFIDPMPFVVSMPGMFSMEPGEGLGDGIGMFIPGMFLGISGEADGVGEAFGFCMPGISVFAGVGEGEAFGIVCPGCCADAGDRLKIKIRRISDTRPIVRKMNCIPITSRVIGRGPN